MPSVDQRWSLLVISLLFNFNLSNSSLSMLYYRAKAAQRPTYIPVEVNSFFSTLILAGRVRIVIVFIKGGGAYGIGGGGGGGAGGGGIGMTYFRPLMSCRDPNLDVDLKYPFIYSLQLPPKLNNALKV